MSERIAMLMDDERIFAEWMEHLRRVAVQVFGWSIEDVLAIRDEDFRFYFMDGCSPETALMLRRDERAETRRTAS